jgi:hypothetical protein
MPAKPNGVDVALAAIFILWMIGTVLRQLPYSGAKRLLTYDWIGIFPLWSFFAPQPGGSDFHLLYRDQIREGENTGWMEHFKDSPRGRWAWVWNPDRRLRKALLDIAQELAIDQASGVSRQAIVLSVPYLALLNFVSNVPRSFPATGTQFAVMMSDGAIHDQHPKVLFLSSFHPLAS